MTPDKTPKINNKNEGSFFKDYQALMTTMERLKKDENNPFFKSKYVPLREVLAEVKKVCAENNFIFYQYPITGNFSADEGKITPISTLKTIIEHKDGRRIEGEIAIISKDFTDPQKVGAGITYMRRYSLTCMFGIEEEDDDGKKVSAAKKESKDSKVDHVKEQIKKQCDKMNPALKTAEDYRKFIKAMTDLDLDPKNYAQILEKLIEVANQPDETKEELDKIGDDIK